MPAEDQGGASGTGSARPDASRGDVPPHKRGASGTGSARPDASRGEVPPHKRGASGTGSARPDAWRGDVPPLEKDEPQPITLIDETGRERQFRLHDAFDHDRAVYYLVENVNDPSQVLLLREAGDALEAVEGDEFQKVIAALEEDNVE